MAKINGQSVKTVIKIMEGTCKKYLPSILIGFGISGFIVGTFVAVKATPDAYAELEEQAEEEKRIGEMLDKPPKKDLVARGKIILKHYWPTAMIIITSAGCIIFANYTHLRREAALAAAYKLSQKNLDDLRNKIVETDGKKKLQQLTDAIVKDDAGKDNGEAEAKAIYVGGGIHRCKVQSYGIVFYSEIEKVNRAEVELDKLLLKNNSATLDDYFEYLGIPEDRRPSIATDVGWTVYDINDLPEFEYKSILDGGVPTYVICFDVEPKHDYWKD